MGSFSEGASRRRCVPAAEAEQGRTGAISYQTPHHHHHHPPCYMSDDVLNQSTTGVSLFCALVLAAETLDRFRAGLRSDSGRDRCRYPRRVGGPQRNGRYQSNPETPQPARHTADLRARQREHTNTRHGGVCECRFHRFISLCLCQFHPPIIKGGDSNNITTKTTRRIYLIIRFISCDVSVKVDFFLVC